jgi:putative ABC transport system permease protein
MAEFILDDPNWGTALVLSAIVITILAVVAVLAIQKPVFFRMSMRNAFRRRSQTTVVVLGLMVGTAILSASFIASDSMEYWIVEDVYTNQYLVDEWVGAEASGTFDYSVYEALAADPDVSAVTDGMSPIIMLSGTSINNLDEGQTETGVNVQGIDLELDRALGEFHPVNGGQITSSDLGPFEAIVTKSLARTARIDVGDSIMVYYVPPQPANATSPVDPSGGGEADAYDGGIHFVVLTAAHIVDDTGKTNHNEGRTIFVTLETTQEMAGAPGVINAIKVSNNGDVVEGTKLSGEAVEALEGALTDVAPMVGMTKDQFTVNPAKENGIQAAEDASAEIGNLLLVASSFTVVAGTLLIINIFTMLAEERKKELGISRAIGMRRSNLVRAFTFEGVVYSLIAATFGTLIGLGIGWGLINGFLGAIEGTGTIPFYYKNSSVLIAFCIGTLITIGTVAYSSWKISKLNIVRSIRSMEEPKLRKGGMKSVYQGIGLVALGSLLSAVGFANEGSLVLQAIGPSLMIIGGCLILRRYISVELTSSAMGLGLVAYSIWALFNLEAADDSEGMMATVVTGLLLVGGSVLAIVSNSRAIVGGVSSILSRTPRGKAVGTPAIAHPLNKGFRTAMTIAMFGLIIFIVVVFSIFGSIFNPDAEGEKGGYDLIATSSMPVDDIHNITFAGDGTGMPQVSYDTLEDKIQDAHGITEHYVYGNLIIDGEELSPYGIYYHGLLGIDEGFGLHTEYGFSERSSQYATDRDAWLAVTQDPDLCIIDRITFGNYHDIKIGSTIAISDGSGLGGSRNYTVIGIADEFAFSEIFVQKEGLRADFPQLQGDNLFLMTVKDGEDMHKVAKDLEADLTAVGMDVFVFDDLIEEYNQAIDQIFSMFTMFMGLGLVVGVASLGVLAIRSVIERKQEIGIMRAIGYRRGMVLGVFSTEMLFVTVVGILVGVATGIITGYGIWKTNLSEFALDFVMPWDNVLMVIAITILAAIVCTFLPALKASRTNPAEAVRWIE